MKTRITIFTLTILSSYMLFPVLAQGEVVPAIGIESNRKEIKNVEAPPPVNVISGVQYPLSKKEKEAIKLANQWKNNNDMPARGEDGSAVFLYGATLPSVVCAPLYACNLRLQQGESILQVDVADSVRWRVTPTTFGKGVDETTALVIKPTDSGLKTDMVVSTDRRLYIVKLVSRINDWMPLVSFSYPEEIDEKWAAYHAEKRKQIEEKIIPATGQHIASLDFGFTLSGDQPSWRPLRVYSDGKKTYIQFPSTIESMEVPALVVIGVNNKEQLVNYRMIGNSYVVDQVIKTAVLISGVGHHQVKVYIKNTRRMS